MLHGDARSAHGVLDAFELADDCCDTFNDVAAFLDRREGFLWETADDKIIDFEMISSSSKNFFGSEATETSMRAPAIPKTLMRVHGLIRYGEQTWDQSEPLQCAHWQLRPT